MITEQKQITIFSQGMCAFLMLCGFKCHEMVHNEETNKNSFVFSNTQKTRELMEKYNKFQELIKPIISLIKNS